MRKTLIKLLIIIPLLLSCEGNNKKNALSEAEKKINDSIAAEKAKMGIWSIHEYTNDFDEPTGEKYLLAEIDGFFSNSAVSMRELGGYIHVTSNGNIVFRFDEYKDGTLETRDRDLPRGTGGLMGSSIICKEKRKRFYHSGQHNSQYFNEWDENNKIIKKNIDWVNILKDEGVYKYDFYYKYDVSYHFTIDSRGLKYAMNKAGIKGNKE